MPGQCWSRGVDAVPTLPRHWINLEDIGSRLGNIPPLPMSLRYCLVSGASFHQTRRRISNSLPRDFTNKIRCEGLCLGAVVHNGRQKCIILSAQSITGHKTSNALRSSCPHVIRSFFYAIQFWILRDQNCPIFSC